MTKEEEPLKMEFGRKPRKVRRARVSGKYNRLEHKIVVWVRCPDQFGHLEETITKVLCHEINHAYQLEGQWFCYHGQARRAVERAASWGVFE